MMSRLTGENIKKSYFVLFESLPFANLDVEKNVKKISQKLLQLGHTGKCIR